MAVPNQKFREIVFQLLYSYDFGGASVESMIDLLSSELSVTKKTVKEAQKKVLLVLDKKDEIDACLEKTSDAYAFERIQTVERNILRIGAYELLYEKSLPQKIVIAEAMRLSRKFGTKEAANFVNAILDAIHKTSSGKSVKNAEMKKIAQELKMHEKASHGAATKNE